jgi:hypothetical protein
MNYFLIGGDKKEYGPYSSEEIRKWVAEGRANGETLLRPEGETLWKPLSFFPAFSDLKPEPPSGPPPLPKAAEPVEEANVSFSVGHAFARAWHLVGEHFGTLFGACFVAWAAITAMLFFPLLGGLLEFIFFGPIFGGLFLVFLKVIRGGEASAGEVFSLAKGNTGNLILAHIVATILTKVAWCCLIVPGIYFYIAWLLAVPLVADRGVDFWQGMEASRRAVTRYWFKFCALFVLGFLPVLVFNIYFMYHMTADMFPLVRKIFEMAASGAVGPADIEKFQAELLAVAKGYGLWMLVKQVLFLISLPLGIGSLAFMYEDLFGRRK